MKRSAISYEGVASERSCCCTWAITRASHVWQLQAHQKAQQIAVTVNEVRVTRNYSSLCHCCSAHCFLPLLQRTSLSYHCLHGTAGSGTGAYHQARRSVSDSFCTPGLRKIALGFRVGMHDVSWCGVASVRFSRKLASLPTCSMLTRIRRCFSVTMCGWFRGVLQVAGADTEQTVRHVVVNGWKGASPHEPLQEGSEPGQLVAFWVF